MKKVRCAIYTRKSSEQGLEQDFNSLHAQHEACAAYILSQTSEGWSLLEEEYDDGGLSGGTLERPALQRLLGDIEAGKIDIVVVYKVDRLTRSLIDFAKLVETMDRTEVSFVSVTQSFNTTNSMGRLTLNMLLSFAQFEREVTAERIRDKIAASKAKGMWMGGIVPLGYEANGRTLAIVEEHAAVIRDLFRRYCEIGNVRLLKEQLDDEGMMLPERFTATGRKMGGVPFTRGQIYKILSNPVYIGEIHHKGQAYDGQHEAIIEPELWAMVQEQLAANRQGEQRAPTIKARSVLAGKVFDEHGEPLVASHACKGKVRYRYYVGKNGSDEAERSDGGWRVPALELEKAVCEGIADEVCQPLALVDKIGLRLLPDQVSPLTRTAQQLADRLSKRERQVVRLLVGEVRISRDTITVQLNTGSVLAEMGLEMPEDEPTALSIIIPVRLKRSGRAMRLLQFDGRAPGTPEPQEHLVKLLHRAGSCWSEMLDRGLSPAAFAREQGVTSSYVTRLVRLNFLAPRIIESIVSGTQPAVLDAKTLLGQSDLPLDWLRQEDLLLR